MKTTLEDSIANAVEECRCISITLTAATERLAKHLKLRAILDDPKSTIRKRLSEIEWMEEDSKDLARLNCYLGMNGPASHLSNMVNRVAQQVSFCDNQVELCYNEDELILQFASVKIKAKLIQILNLRLEED